VDLFCCYGLHITSRDDYSKINYNNDQVHQYFFLSHVPDLATSPMIVASVSYCCLLHFYANFWSIIITNASPEPQTPRSLNTSMMPMDTPWAKLHFFFHLPPHQALQCHFCHCNATFTFQNPKVPHSLSLSLESPHEACKATFKKPEVFFLYSFFYFFFPLLY